MPTRFVSGTIVCIFPLSPLQTQKCYLIMHLVTSEISYRRPRTGELLQNVWCTHSCAQHTCLYENIREVNLILPIWHHLLQNPLGLCCSQYTQEFRPSCLEEFKPGLLRWACHDCHSLPGLSPFAILPVIKHPFSSKSRGSFFFFLLCSLTFVAVWFERKKKQKCWSIRTDKNNILTHILTPWLDVGKCFQSTVCNN